jgi:hypothetical protein
MAATPTFAFRSAFELPSTLQPQLPPLLLAEVSPSDRPLALFPVRLETRFFAQPDSSSELRVRVYPDRIHIDSHEAELTPTEKTWGQHYWTQIWRAGNDEQAQKNAWRQLVERYDSRAAWIARALRPKNMESRPDRPVPQEEALSPAPSFPTVAVASGDEESSWRNAPHARLLPDRWFAVVHSDGRPVTAITGPTIRQELAVGPDPKAPAVEIAGDEPAVDEGMRWMVDFAAAEEAGMALRIPLSAQVVAKGVDLFVFGASSAAADVGAQQLGEQLDAQHYTDGLEFLRPGTPSNNTTTERSGYSADPGHERSFKTESGAVEVSLAPQSNARVLGRALGLPAGEIANILGGVNSGSDGHELDLRSMNTALWQSTWGYFLSNMIGMEATGLTPEILAWVREHFIATVRAGGPFPPVRCGKQPYGILPVTSLDLWQPEADEAMRDQWLHDFLVSLRDKVWRPRLPDVARLGRRTSPPDPDADLSDVMRTDGVSYGYNARTMFGRHYQEHLRAFLGQSLQGVGFNQINDQLTSDILQLLRFDWRSRLSSGTYGDTAWRVSAPLVQAGEISRWRKLEPNYIADLLADRGIASLVGKQPAAGTSLLQALLRHSLLLEYANATAAIAGTQPGTNLAQLLRDRELIDLVNGEPLSVTWKRLLGTTVSGITGARTIREHLESVSAFNTPQLTALGEFREALTHLQTLDSESLQHLMQGTIDLASYRLDAWITSLATKRLTRMRASNAQGTYIGGYGWVENLKPAPGARTEVQPPPAGETGPIFTYPNDSGFIHTPSMNHASTAALLRNAQLGATGVPSESSAFAIDLSSRRVREASWLLDGVRQGQPLGALLGYRLERTLHELGLDRFVYPLRELAPLSARKLQHSDRPLETIAANNVVDGLLLNQKWLDDGRAVRARLQGATEAELKKMTVELNSLADSIDAVSDALTAETAYQMVRGNNSRLASTLNALANGDAPAPELEVARTPRTGIPLTHRLLQLFSGSTPSTAGWAAVSTSARAAGDPVLNAWAAKLLGDPRKVRCTVERLDENGSVLETRAVLLSDLKLVALDVVYGVEVQANARQSSEIEQQVLYHVRRGTNAFAQDAQLRIQHARPADLAATELTVLDVLEQARRLRRLLATARPADPDDLTPTERGESGTVNLTELSGRVTKAEKALKAAHKALDILVKKGTADAETLRSALLKLGSFGFSGGLPVSAAGDDATARAALNMQGVALLKESNVRIEEVDALIAAPVPAEPRARRDKLLERMRTALGSGFVAMPLFTCAHGGELKSALAASAKVQGGDALAVYTWFTRCARVRDPVARLSAPLRGAEVLGSTERLNLKVAQLPFADTDRWVGLPAEEGKNVQAGKLSLVVQAAAALNPEQAMCGLLVDEWVEVVPSATETTAIAFQFNPPDACAPQSVLLAVPPVPDQPWTVASLHRVLVETLDLAKLRAVDAEALSEIAHYLPATFMAFNANNEVASTDFTELTR